MWFFPRKPVRFVAKGRGPSGEWWRLGGWLGRFAEPCALLRTGEWSTRPCFLELQTGRTNLGARLFAPCEKDVFVFGVAARTWERVRVLLADGGRVDAALFDPPRRSLVPERYFVAVLPEGTGVRAMEAVEPDGDLLRRRLVGDIGTPCAHPQGI